jgi:hypothetical protein
MNRNGNTTGRGGASSSSSSSSSVHLSSTNTPAPTVIMSTTTHSSSSPNVAAKAASLIDMGQGLLTRIYLLKSKLSNPAKRELYLGGNALKAVRSALVTKFPAMPSINKLTTDRIPGGSRFVSNASNTCRILSTFRDLIYDIVDFALTTSKLIVDMPAHHMVTIDFENNRDM